MLSVLLRLNKLQTPSPLCAHAKLASPNAVNFITVLSLYLAPSFKWYSQPPPGLHRPQSWPRPPIMPTPFAAQPDLTNLVACSSSCKSKALLRHMTTSETCTCFVTTAKALANSPGPSSPGPSRYTWSLVSYQTRCAIYTRSVLRTTHVRALTSCNAAWSIEREGAPHHAEDDTARDQEGLLKLLDCSSWTHVPRQHRRHDPHHGQGRYIRYQERARRPRPGALDFTQMNPQRSC